MHHSQDKRCFIVLRALSQIRRRFACDQSYYRSNFLQRFCINKNPHANTC